MDKHAVVRLMSSSKSEKEWNLNCDKVKAAYDGKYPGFWYSAVIMSGVIGQTQALFTSQSDKREDINAI